MYRLLIFSIILKITILCSCEHSFAQNKQANLLGSEIFADAPVVLPITGINGDTLSLPILIACHDAHGLSNSKRLVDITIFIKNADEVSFGNPITFDNYSDSAFYTLFDFRSQEHTELSIQKFNTSTFIKSSTVTINFISDTATWIPPIYYHRINKRWWYFVFNIPKEKLKAYGNIIDVKVSFNLDYEVDKDTYLRIFRKNNVFPELDDWYRGDTHFHTYFTENSAEIGLPLDVSAYFSKIAGLSWVVMTDHSCDYDNFDIPMHDVWNYQKDMAISINDTADAFKYIHGIEMSVANSQNKLVHGLVFPNPDSPYALPYIGDGTGDLIPPSLRILHILDSCQKYNAFMYAAHPFSEGDKLSDVVGGNVWNLSSENHPVNGNPALSTGTVIWNDTAASSDIWDSLGVIHPALKGGQLMNLYNSLTNTDQAYNPWNANYSSYVANFSALDSINYMHFWVRYLQNFDAYRTILQKGISNKNSGLPGSWKHYQIGGSDAHGSFNYSNTDYSFGLIGAITNNAVGKVFTYAYCPNGMGANAENVLYALKNGHTIASTGPFAVLTLINQNQEETIPGNDKFLSADELSSTSLVINLATTDWYGEFFSVQLFAGTSDTNVVMSIPLSDNINAYSFPFDSILNVLFGNIPESWFYIMLRAESFADRQPYEYLYRQQREYFVAASSPIWIKTDALSKLEYNDNNNAVRVFPLPFHDELIIESTTQQALGDIFLFDISGRIVYSKKEISNRHTIPTAKLNSGFYILRYSQNGRIMHKKLVKRE